MRIAYTPASLRDLASIGNFIAVDSPRRAKTFVAELRVACRSLGSDSFRYPLQDELPGVRRMPFGSYLVLYRVFDDRVQIIRIVHSARDVGGLSFGD